MPTSGERPGVAVSVADVQVRLFLRAEARMETQWIRRWNSWIAAKPVKPGVFRRKEGGFLVRGRVTDPRTGRLKEVKLTLDDVEAVEASRRLREALA